MVGMQSIPMRGKGTVKGDMNRSMGAVFEHELIPFFPQLKGDKGEEVLLSKTSNLSGIGSEVI